MGDKLIIFDTTLRDGEQSPGASMTSDEKLRIAKALDRMRVDVIEAGFPVASEGDFDAVKRVACAIEDAAVCGLARALDKDIDIAAKALKPARRKRIHTFLATSPIHMRDKLNMTPDEVIARSVSAVKLARKYTDEVEFSPEDAGRSEFDFLCRVLEAVINAGATTVNIPDTVGYSIPQYFGELIKRLINNIPNSDRAVFSVHCHNDLGLAVSNSLAAVMNGARQVECTVNGLGERAGNAALEEIVMSVRTRQDVFSCDTSLDTTKILDCSRLVSTITGFPVQPNKAIVGANAFSHESGIHQDGVLKCRETYEIMRAEDIGWNANRMVLGKHSGRRALRNRLEELGVDLGKDEELNALFTKFKALADKKHDIYDEDLQALISESTSLSRGGNIQLKGLKVLIKTGALTEAEVVLSIAASEQTARTTGSGPVDAAFQAVEQIVKSNCELKLYSVNNITGGTDSQGEVSVRLSKNGKIANGAGADTDIITASIKAYINALNKILDNVERAHPQLRSI